MSTFCDFVDMLQIEQANIALCDQIRYQICGALATVIIPRITDMADKAEYEKILAQYRAEDNGPGRIFAQYATPDLSSAKPLEKPMFADDNPVVRRGALIPGGTYADGTTRIAWPGIMHDAWQGYQEFSRADPTDNSQAATDRLSKAAFDVSGMAMTGGLAAPRPANSIGMFGGKLAKTADQAALAEAEKMAAAGAPREEIWNKTGWFSGADGKWRFEIDDSNARMVNPFLSPEMAERHIRADPASKGNVMPQALGIDDFIAHPGLERAYWPVRESAPSVMYQDLGKTKGMYSPSSDMVTMDSGSVLARDMGKSTALHELQHALQHREGFASGAPGVPSEKYFAVPGLKETAQQTFMEKQKAWAAQNPGAVRSPEGLTNQWMQEALYEAYKRVAGEVEARTVQKRMDLTPEERRARPPWLDYDVPEKDQIVRFGSSHPQMSAEDILKKEYGSTTGTAPGEASAITLPPEQAKAFWDAVKPLDAKLEGDFARAMDDWVGGSHDTMSKGINGGLMMPERLEGLPPQQLDQMAAPVRDILRKAYGDTITVYRGEGGGNPSTGRAGNLMSYTTDPQVAERFAGAQTKAMPLISDAEIAAAEKQLAAAGEVTIGGKTYRQKPGSEYVDIYDRDGHFVTDTDSLRSDLGSLNEWRSGLNTDRDAALQKVRAVQIPVDQVVWATDRFGQKEIIAKAGAEQPVPNGERISGQAGREGRLNQPNLSAQEILQREYGDTPEPLRGYHGTSENITKFDPSIRGETTGAESARNAFWFAKSQELSSDYAVLAGNGPLAAVERKLAAFEDKARAGHMLSPEEAAEARRLYGDRDRITSELKDGLGVMEGANVIPADLRFKNPLVHDYAGAPYRDESFSSLVNKANEGGHDGLILKNTYDPAFPLQGRELTDIYGATKPGTVYSATTGDLLYSNPKEAAALPLAAKALEGEARLRRGKFDLDYFGQSVRILQNPSPQQLEGAIGRTKYKAMRRIQDDTGNTYVWDAADPALHEMVAKELGIDPRTLKISDMIGID